MSEQRVVKINTSEKVQLPNALPMELVKADLEDELMIVGNVYYAVVENNVPIK